MKRIILFFTVCLGLSVSQTTLAVNEDVVRTATKRSQSTPVSVKSSASRSLTSDTKSDGGTQKNARTATKTSQQRVATRTPTTQQNLKSRTATVTPAKNVTARTATATGATRITATRKSNAQTNNARSTTNVKARATTKPLNIEKLENIKSANYSRCRTVYYECMDEFCANKDANLRRCACSSRIHEFDNIQKQLDKAEDKMLEFNRRLLTVGLDKEDAAAINIATEGETAFSIKDRTDSEKALQKITKALDYSPDSKNENKMSSLSWDLNVDTAWDDVDAFGGIATSSKTGPDLYNAARPICIEMAKEVCSDEELKIAQDGYTLTIQQDCNTVEKSYGTLSNQVIEKVHESSALLDMSRLNIYQERNSDDTLTCKKKILDQLSNTSVCGDNLHKCLDMTGEYIDPSNGKAFLSENLYNLANLLEEPTGDEKWSTLPQNEKFVSFLKSKKKFLEPAIKQCQDIADTIWKEFLDDALSQIKLAQKAKLEEVRQGCTKLVAECKTNAINDLSEFDSRALSVFSVIADKTVNEMCSNVQNSCVALMNADDLNADWSSGMSGIATDVTYDKIIETCTQIGRDCIIQNCNGTSGNFALCTNTTSDIRISILKRNMCWDEVLNCVKNADNLDKMGNLANSTTICNENDTACLIAEQIWGNCEKNNDDTLITNIDNIQTVLGENVAISSNKILIPDTGTTLLSWFATNTNTADANDSCNTYGCPINYMRNSDGTCQLLYSGDIPTTNDCHTPIRRDQIINVAPNITNYCATSVRDAFGNCCADGYKSNGICVKDQSTHALYFMTTTCDITSACAGLDETTTPTDTECSANRDYYCPNAALSRQIYLYCITPQDYISYNNQSNTYDCEGGFWLLIDQYGNYFNATPSGNQAPTMSYRQSEDCDTTNSTEIPYKYDSNTNVWTFEGASDISTAVPTDNEFMIKYE